MEDNTRISSSYPTLSGKMRPKVSRTRRAAPYAKSLSRDRNQNVAKLDDNNGDKGLIGRVTDMIVPDWISSWWKPKDHNTFDDVPPDEDSNESDIEEASAPSSNGQPPFNNPLIFEKQANTLIHTPLDTHKNDNEEANYSNTLQQHIFTTNTEKRTSSESLNRPSLLRKDISDPKTAEFNKKRKVIEEEEHTIEVDSSKESSTKQTFYESFRSSHKPVTATQPAFKVSAFVSPRSLISSVSFNTSLNSSSFDFSSARSLFYTGGTVYGGSSSVRQSSNKRVKLSPVSNRARTTRTHVRAKPLPSNKRSTVTSDTAKRILSTLGQMSSPLKDSRSLPVSSNAPSFSEMLKNRSKNDKLEQSKPPTKTLNCPKPLEITQNFSNKYDSIKRFNEKNSENNSNNCFKNVASNNVVSTNNVVSISNVLSFSTPETVSSKASMKMKSKKTSMHYSSNIDNVEVVNTMPEVTKSTVPLAITSLPKFNFSAIKPTISNQDKPSSTFLTSVTPIIKNSTGSKFKASENNDFMFSSPDVIESKKTFSAPATKDFSFSSPVNLTTIQKRVEKLQFKPTPVTNIKNVESSNILKFKKFQPPEGSWSCPTCMINNKKDDLKCVACMESKPGNPSTQSSLSTSLQNKSIPNANFKLNIAQPPEGSWRCTLCMINNTKDSLKCAACTEPKPGTKPSNSLATAAPALKTLKLKFGQQEVGSWDCPTCLINNKEDNLKCAACTEPKPGASKEEPKSDNPIFKTKPQQMKFIQNKEGCWDCPTCMITNKNELLNCEACNEVKPGVKSEHTSQTTGFSFRALKPSTESGFSFGAPKLSTESFGAPKLSTESGFSFGAPKSSTESGFSFGAPKPSTESFGAPKLSTESGFSFGAPKSSTESGFSFGAPKSSTESGFSFGAPKSSTESGFSFSAPKPSTESGFAFGASQKNDSGFSFSSSNTKEVTSGFKFASSETNNKTGESTGITGFSFSKPATTDSPSSGFSFDTPNETAPPQASFQFGAPASINKAEEPVSQQAFPSIADAAKAGVLKVTEIDNRKIETKEEPTASTAVLFEPANSGSVQFGSDKPTDLFNAPEPASTFDSNTTAPFTFGKPTGVTQGITETVNPADVLNGPIFGGAAKDFVLQNSFSNEPTKSAVVEPPNSLFSFGSAVLPASTKSFGSASSTSQAFGFATQSNNVFGSTNGSLGQSAGPTLNFGASAATPKPSASFNFGSSSAVPSFETKPASSFNLSSTNTNDLSTQGFNSDTKPTSSGFSFSTAAAPSFNFGTTINKPSFASDTNNSIPSSNMFAQPPSGSNLFSMGQSNPSSAGSLFNVGQSNVNPSAPTGTQRRQIKRAARRLKK